MLLAVLGVQEMKICDYSTSLLFYHLLLLVARHILIHTSK